MSELADALNPFGAHSYQPTPVQTLPAIAHSKPRRQYRASSTPKRYQLNVRVSTEHRGAIKRYAKQHRMKVWEAVELAIAALTREQ